MRGTARPRVLVVLATTVGLAATGLAVAPAAHAGPPGHWTRLDTGTHLSSIQEPSVARFGKSLEVVWSQPDDAGSSKNSVRVRPVSAAGVAGTQRTIVSNWSSLVQDPSPVVTGGHLLVAFGGIRTINSGEKYSGAMAFATSPTGVAWTLGSGSLTKTKSAYGSYGQDIVDDAGTPVIATVAGSADFVTLHRGIDASMPAASNDYFSSTIGSCCAYSAALAQDAKTHGIYTAFYSNGTNKDGIWVQKVANGANGSLVRAPGSHYSGGGFTGSLPPDGEVAMVARPGGGVYLAYEIGYPSVKKIRLWKVGASKFHDISAPNARAISLGVGQGGRLWVAWADPTVSRIHAIRTSKSVNGFGAVASAPYPKLHANVGYVYKMAINGSQGPLDVVVNSQVPGKTYEGIYHTQLYAPLTVKLSRTSVKSSTGGSVTVTVTEAGAAVVGAKVVFNGVTVKTNSHGKAVVKVKKHAATGKKTLTVSLKYYVTKRLTIKVT